MTVQAKPKMSGYIKQGITNWYSYRINAQTADNYTPGGNFTDKVEGKRYYFTRSAPSTTMRFVLVAAGVALAIAFVARHR